MMHASECLGCRTEVFLYISSSVLVEHRGPLKKKKKKPSANKPRAATYQHSVLCFATFGVNLDAMDELDR